MTATFIQGKTHRTVDLSADPNLGNETEGEEQDDDRELPLNATEDERAAFWEEVRHPRATKPPVVLSVRSLNSFKKPAK